MASILTIEVYSLEDRQKIEKYEKMLRGTILILQNRQKIETYEKMFRRPILMAQNRQKIEKFKKCSGANIDSENYIKGTFELTERICRFKR